jgi:hypothetical protein
LRVDARCQTLHNPIAKGTMPKEKPGRTPKIVSTESAHFNLKILVFVLWVTTGIA